MKKNYFLLRGSGLACTLLLFCFSLFSVISSQGQVATYPLTSGSGGSGTASTAGTGTNVTAGTLISGSQMLASSYNSSGYRVKTNSLVWPSAITDGYGFDIPLSPKTGFDFSLTGITAEINSQSYNTNTTNLYIEPYYQIDGNGVWKRLNNAVTATVTATNTSINFGPVSDAFYSGHTYIFRFYVYASAVSDKNDNFRIKNMVFNGVVAGPPSVAPIVTTIAPATSITKYSANVNGTYSFGTGFRAVNTSGIVWSTTTNPTVLLSTKTTNGASGIINSTLTGLTPNTLYYARAYAITQLDTIYGLNVSFTTLPPTVPSLVTTAVTAIQSNKATSGGNSIDSGGYFITEKGICWNTSPTPTTANFTNNEGTGNASFASTMKNLLPSTTYYVRAYAKNSLGTGYGNELSFTTGTAVPVIAAVPGVINFGNVNFNAAAPVVSYTLSAAYLTPNAGNITVTTPAGSPLKISTSSNSGFGNSLTIPYSIGTLTNTKIYVQFATGTYGNFSSYIAHSGGGALPANTDTVFLAGSIVQDPNVLTNSGTDFWLGFGYQEKMSKTPGDADEARMSVYVTTLSQSATVHVELPGAGYSQSFTIPANSFHEFTNFPIGTGTNDSRLYATGISDKGIHVYSDNNTPVSVFLHTYTNSNSAAGAMIFPTNTWNSSYTVQAYGGSSNTSNPNSFFFVIAKDDNTQVTFTPTQPIVNAASAFSSNQTTAANTAYAAGGTYTVTLNKGQIFNAMGGFGSGSTGLDLSGSTVKTSCDKKIAVFGGNGRVLVNANVANCTASSGSDHLIQQMFPTVAWGTRYLTNPTKTMEFNYFRIYVQDASTVVKVNGTALANTTLVNNLYYQYSSSQPLLIESDKPINVSQFITAGDCAVNNGSKGSGDPEMIILSPLQQAITNATVYSSPFKGTNASPAVKPALSNGTIGNCASFLNVIIPNAGVASFKLDGLNVADTGMASAAVCPQSGGNRDCIAFSASTIMLPMAQAFKPHPQDPNYSIAKFWVTTGAAHTLSSDIGFNAIAYGVGDGESYGYNAGTAVKDLSSISIAQNPFGTDTSSSLIKTCKGNPVTLKIALPYLPYKVDSIVWNPRSNPVAPSGAVKGTLAPDASNPSGFSAQYSGTTVVDGQTFYIYTCPVTYTFSQEGTFHLTATAYGTFASDCSGFAEKPIDVMVGHDDISFTAIPGACGSTAVTFTDNSTPLTGTTIKQWQWDFGDATTFTGTPSSPNPTPNPHIYPPISSGVTSYWAKLKTINSVGCFNTDSVFIDLSYNLKAKFVASPDTICSGGTVTFTDQSTANAVEWTWNWDDGTPNTVVTGTSPTPAVTHTFTNTTNANITRKVKLFVKNAAGCTSATVDTNIVVIAKPVVDFNTPPGICLGGSMQFTNISTPTTGVSYAWNFGDAANSTPSNPNTSTLQNPSHIYTTTGPFSVTLTVTDNHYGCSDTKIKALSSTIYQLPTAIINAPSSACLKDTVQFIDASTAGTGNTVTDWAWTFGDGGTATIQNPKHPYYVTGSQSVTLTVKNDKGCVSSVTSQPINIKPIPNVTFSAIPNICLNAAAMTITQASETTGIAGATPTPWAYTGTGVSGTSFNPLTAGVGSAQVIATFTAANGCKDADTTTITVLPLPLVSFTVSSTTCEKSAITFTSTSTPNAASIQSLTWNFNDAGSTANVSPATHTYNTAATYNVVLTVTNSNNCTASLPQQVIVHNRPFANFSLPASVCLPDGGATFTNLSTVADDANPSYSWNFGDPNDPSGSTSPNPTHHYSSTSASGFPVMLTVTSQYNCKKDTTIALLNVYPQPLAAYTTDRPEVCLTDSFTFINQSASAAVTWQWDFGDNTTNTVSQGPKHTYTSAGTFYTSYSYVDSKGCISNVAKDTLTVNPNPVVDAGPTVYILQGNAAVLKATAGGSSVLDYLWTPLNPTTYLNYDTLLNPLCMPLTDEFYTLTVTGAGGCYAQDTMSVKLLMEPVIPNAFSPNGDGINDTWEIGNLSTYFGATVEVFNRNGQQVCMIKGYSTGWDGRVNGKPLPVGTYYYIINPKNGHKIMSGNVTILR